MHIFLNHREVIYVQFDALMYIGIGELNTLEGLCQPTFGVKKFCKVGKPILQEFFITFYYEQVLCCLSITCTNITYLKKDITAFECASIIIFFNNLRSSFYKVRFFFQLKSDHRKKKVFMCINKQRKIYIIELRKFSFH